MAKTSTQDWLSIIAITLAVFAILLVVAKGGQKVVLQESQTDTLSVSGNAELFVEPDKAEVFVRVESRDEDAQQAQLDNRETADDVRQALVEAGVEEDDMETTQYSLQRVEEYNPETRQREFRGYKLVHVMKVTTEDLDNVGSIIDSAVEAGANGVDRVEFGLTQGKMEKSRDEALSKASRETRGKAESLADNLGVRLGDPVRISESQYDFIPYRASDMMVAADEAGGAAGTQISPQKVEIRARVSVDYRIG